MPTRPMATLRVFTETPPTSMYEYCTPDSAEVWRTSRLTRDGTAVSIGGDEKSPELYGCTIHVGICVRAGDAEVDISYSIISYSL